jgi:hypothetical protein
MRGVLSIGQPPDVGGSVRQATPLGRMGVGQARQPVR